MIKLHFNSVEEQQKLGYAFKGIYEKEDKTSIEVLLDSVSKDQNRFFITGVFLDTDEQKLVATDGKRLAYIDYCIDNDITDLITTTNKKSRIYNYVHNSKKKTVYFGLESKIKFNFNNVAKGLLTSVEDNILNCSNLIVDMENKVIWNKKDTHIDGIFPNWQKVVPTSFTSSFTFNLDNFNIFNKKYSNKTEFTNNNCFVDLESGRMWKELPKYNAKLVEDKLNGVVVTENLTQYQWRFNADMLKKLKGSIKFECQDNNNKAIMTKLYNGIYIQMPMFFDI